jgi:hypothetical protein
MGQRIDQALDEIGASVPAADQSNNTAHQNRTPLQVA